MTIGRFLERNSLPEIAKRFGEQSVLKRFIYQRLARFSKGDKQISEQQFPTDCKTLMKWHAILCSAAPWQTVIKASDFTLFHVIATTFRFSEANEAHAAARSIWTQAASQPAVLKWLFQQQKAATVSADNRSETDALRLWPQLRHMPNKSHYAWYAEVVRTGSVEAVKLMLKVLSMQMPACLSCPVSCMLSYTSGMVNLA